MYQSFNRTCFKTCYTKFYTILPIPCFLNLTWHAQLHYECQYNIVTADSDKYGNNSNEPCKIWSSQGQYKLCNEVPQSLTKGTVTVSKFSPSWYGEVHCNRKPANRTSQASGGRWSPLSESGQCSNLGPDTGNPDWNYSWSSSVPSGKCQDSTFNYALTAFFHTRFN
jgi:hypothetical protein